MATIRPFDALLPRPDLAARICELPYDVMSSEEARQLAAGNPLSFLRVSKPEIELPDGTDPYSDAVYARGRENFRQMIARGDLVRDSRPCLYLYRQVMGTHSQTGIVAAASCSEYLDGTVRRHELTRVDKENDRVRHIETLEAQTGPVFLVYRAVADLDAFIERKTLETPYVDFTAADGVRHTSWRLADDADIRFVTECMAGVPRLYIADGHHRSAAAARVFQSRGGVGNTSGFLSVIFPHTQVRILPYNRALRDLNGRSPAALLRALEDVFEIREDNGGVPSRKHEVGLYIEGTWRLLTFRPEVSAGADAIGGLDVSLLQDRVLRPFFAIDDPRTSNRIHFVGGIRGTVELERLVDSREYACAFSMHPTGIEDLMAVADEGGIMPPKSTWFEPKLRDAMFCLML